MSNSSLHALSSRAPLLALLVTPLAAAQELESYRPSLWDREGPTCILQARDAAPQAVPAPELRPNLSERYGRGVTEDTLLPDALRAGGEHHAESGSLDSPGTLISYTDPRLSGFNDPVLGTQRRAAFEFAVARVVALIGGSGNLSIDASFPAKNKPGNYASASPGQFWKNVSGMPANIWYPEFLVEHITGTDPDASQLDIVVSFNSDWDDDGTVTWYYGTDGNPPSDRIDLVTVAMHELIHGLGFAPSFLSSGQLFRPEPDIYDLFLVNDELEPLVSLTPSSFNVAGLPVLWSGPFGTLAFTTIFGGTGQIKIYAPWPWNSGSSISHLDESSFTGKWGLLTPFLSLGEAVQEIDPIVRGMLEDLGYNVNYAEIYVDPSYTGTSTGSPQRPFPSVAAGISAAGGTGRIVRVKGGTYNLSPLVVSSKVTLERWYGSTVTIR